MEFQWLRTPYPERIFSLTERPGFLRIFGRQSIGNWFEQGLVGRRQEHHSFRAETTLDFKAETYQHVAGLTHYYGRFKFHALGLSWDEELGTSLIILSCPGAYPTGKLEYPIGMGVSVPEGVLDLAMEVRDNDLQFFWRKSGEGEWLPVGPVLDASVISDEGGGLNEHGSFTGAFAAMLPSTSPGMASRRILTGLPIGCCEARHSVMPDLIRHPVRMSSARKTP